MTSRICIRKSAIPKDKLPLPYPTVQRTCSRCTAPVVSTSPDTEIQENMGLVEFICDQCAEKSIHAELFRAARLTHEQAR